MSKLIRDLGAGRPYTLTISTSNAGVEVVATPGIVGQYDGPSYTVTLRTEPEVLDLIRALEAACEEMRGVAGNRFFDRAPDAVNQAVQQAETEARPPEPQTEASTTGLKGLNALCDEALRIAVEHGFTDASIGEDFALMHSEISEALEDHRAGKMPDEVWYEEKIKLEDPRVGIALRKTGALVLQHASMMSDVVMDSDQPRRMSKPCGIPSELADVLIRVFHFCGKHGIDIDKAVREKMAYNVSRPMKHGGKVL